MFDGASLAFDAGGEVIARARRARDRSGRRRRRATRATGEAAAPFDRSDERSALDALALGTRDYARRCGFRQALLGLSGGIDSALVACIAARALGPENVLGVAMPSRYSSPGSLADAAGAGARTWASTSATIPIEPMFAAYLETLAPPLERFAPARRRSAAAAADLTAQNLQARVRGAILMALSNRQDRLLLTTGNKSEVATGYCTLYGDMAGGLAVISDVPKTLVYRLARGAQRRRAAGADPGVHADQAALRRAAARPDRPGQPAALRSAGRDPRRAPGRGARRRRRWWRAGSTPRSSTTCVRRVRTSEYKRRQMPPGLKITGKAFGPGRRYPDRPRRGLNGSEGRALKVRRKSGVPPKGTCPFEILACMVRGPLPRRSSRRSCVLPLRFCPVTGSVPRWSREATRVLAAVGEKWGHTFTMREALIGGAAIDKTGTALPPETLAMARETDAVLLGAVGGPKWDDPRGKVRPEQGLLAIRKGLGLYANLRPVAVNPKLLHASPLRPELWPASTCWSCAS